MRKDNGFNIKTSFVLELWTFNTWSSECCLRVSHATVLACFVVNIRLDYLCVQ